MRDKEAEKSVESFVRPEVVDPAATLTVVRVPREWARWRLDRVVVQTFQRMSRTRAQVVVTAGAFTPEGRKLRSNDRVREGDVILLWRPPFEEPEVPLECPVIHEDDRLLAIDKPPGLPVHPTARYHHKTVTALLARARPGELLALCHRIDRETSGALLLAKDREAERYVKRMLEERTEEREGVRAKVDKTYLAITWGVPPEQEFRVTHALKLDDRHRFRVKMRVADGERDALWAATRFEILGARARPGDPTRRYALVRCELETGRQHQIRAHLAAIGTPIVGDKLYGPDDELFARGADGTLTEEDQALLELPRHALHAHELVLPHPSNPRERVTIRAPLPADLAAFWDALRE
ncbi:MAG: RluA family pseudouridine synthase [Deltaproteobacteria bacterium]|nr:RluA family pseudouridine synthase [Deltaproteobacteria bacterium]